LKGARFRLFETKEGYSLDELIDLGLLKEAVAFCEVELTILAEEIEYLSEQIRRLKERLGIGEEVVEE